MSRQSLADWRSLFIDTAPLIYYLEAHPSHGPLMREILATAGDRKARLMTSVVTLCEVLVKPVADGNEQLAAKFSAFLRQARPISLIDINADIAEHAGRLRGRYQSLRTMDALQIAAAIAGGAESFVTNDKRLRQVTEIQMVILDDYLDVIPS